MKTAMSVLTFGGFLAVLIEVVNPHSFLGTTGAFVRVLILAIVIAFWFFKVKKSHPRFFFPGLLVLLILTASYFLYGLNSLCADLYYEKTKNSGNNTEPYNCPVTLKEFYLK